MLLFRSTVALTPYTQGSTTSSRTNMPPSQLSTMARRFQSLGRATTSARFSTTASTRPARSTAPLRPAGLEIRASATHMGPPHYFVWRKPESLSRTQGAGPQLSRSLGPRYHRSSAISRRSNNNTSRSEPSRSWEQYHHGLEAQDRLDDTLREVTRTLREQSRSKTDVVKQVRWVKRLLVAHIFLSQSILGLPWWWIWLGNFFS